MIINRIVLIVYALTLFVLYNFSYLLYVVIGKGITPFHHCVLYNLYNVSCNISPRCICFYELVSTHILMAWRVTVACREIGYPKSDYLRPAMIIIVFSAHEIPIVCKGAGHSVGALKALD